MQKEKHFSPKQATEEFHCPHCGVYAKQYWAHLNAGHHINYTSIHGLTKFDETLNKSWTISKCEHCKEKIIWLDENIIYPRSIPVSLPNEDLDEDIKKDYLEAATIFNDSARSSAALLRLALQKLCKQLGEKGDNINNDIGSMVKKGLNPLVQKSLDSLRITGNNAVHPGEINLEEEPDKVLKLFELINFIAEKMITEPKEISGFYEELPDEAKEQVKKRDD
mgnify:CR=1 FL=1